MSSPSDLLAKSFVGALDSLQNDIKVLKDVKNIRCLLDDKNKSMESKLQEVDCMVSQLEQTFALIEEDLDGQENCLLYTSPSPRDRQKARMPSSA